MQCFAPYFIVFLGPILGVFIALIGIGILVSAFPNVSLVAVVALISTCSIACLIAGALLARRMNKHDAEQVPQSVQVPSEGYVAAYIYATSVLAALLLGSIAFGIFLFIPQPNQVLVLDFTANPDSIPYLFAGSILLCILFSYVGIWYVAHVKHLHPSQSLTKISWWFALVVLIPAVGDWQAVLSYAMNNLLTTIFAVVILGSLAVFVVRFFLQHAERRNVQSN
jgi:hypothetical protein